MSDSVTKSSPPANTLFKLCLHFASTPNVQRFRDSDIIWLHDAMKRLVQALERIFDGDIPELELEEYVSVLKMKQECP